VVTGYAATYAPIEPSTGFSGTAAFLSVLGTGLLIAILSECACGGNEPIAD